MSEEKKENHKTLIVKVTEILPIKDADKIEIVKFGLPYQCVSQKGTFKVGDLAVYVQPDSVVPTTEPFRFIWEPYLTDTVHHPDGRVEYIVPEKRRRITVKKMRGEWSEGLLLPISDFDEGNGWHLGTLHQLDVGEDVSEYLGITHYQPAETDEGQNGEKPVRKVKRPKTVKGWFFFLLHKLHIRRREKFMLATESVDGSYPKYDVDALKSISRNPFEEGERVIVTEKIHGSSARYVFLDGKMYVGSRNLWLAPESGGYARAALKANPKIEEWCRLNEGYALYGEVTPTQKGYQYGSKEHQFFLFDIRHPDGYWVDKGNDLQYHASFYVRQVPYLYIGQYGNFVHSLVDGKSTVPEAENIREGIVINTLKEREIRRGQRAQFKVVSNAFLKKDSE